MRHRTIHQGSRARGSRRSMRCGFRCWGSFGGESRLSVADDRARLRRKAERLLEARRIARPDLPVEHALDRLAVERRDYLLGGEAAHVLARLASDAGRVRRDDDVVELQKGMFERWRLLLPHVEARARNLLCAQSFL